MPELPDITVYLDALRERIHGRALERVRVVSPFLLRSVDTPIDCGGRAARRRSAAARQADRDRLRDGPLVRDPSDDRGPLPMAADVARQAHEADRARPAVRVRHARADGGGHEEARVVVRRARRAAHLAEHDPGGLEIAESGAAEFLAALRSGNHTLKRALTDPHLLERNRQRVLRRDPAPRASVARDARRRGLIGRAGRATASRDARGARRVDGALARANSAASSRARSRRFTTRWRCTAATGSRAPCAARTVQRIRYADNETNYCPRCQTDGKLLADRSLSRLLKRDWPKSIDELERLRSERSPR